MVTEKARVYLCLTLTRNRLQQKASFLLQETIGILDKSTTIYQNQRIMSLHQSNEDILFPVADFPLSVPLQHSREMPLGYDPPKAGVE